MSIRLAEADRTIQAALAKARDLAVNISVTVCDADGRLVAFQRMDGTLAEAHRASYGKALASATSGRPSGDESIEFSEDFKDFRTATVIGEDAPIIRRPCFMAEMVAEPINPPSSANSGDWYMAGRRSAAVRSKMSRRRAWRIGEASTLSASAPARLASSISGTIRSGRSTVRMTSSTPLALAASCRERMFEDDTV